jgi:hypothetical protein
VKPFNDLTGQRLDWFACSATLARTNTARPDGGFTAKHARKLSSFVGQTAERQNKKLRLPASLQRPHQNKMDSRDERGVEVTLQRIDTACD